MCMCVFISACIARREALLTRLPSPPPASPQSPINLRRHYRHHYTQLYYTTHKDTKDKYTHISKFIQNPVWRYRRRHTWSWLCDCDASFSNAYFWRIWQIRGSYQFLIFLCFFQETPWNASLLNIMGSSKNVQTWFVLFIHILLFVYFRFLGWKGMRRIIWNCSHTASSRTVQMPVKVFILRVQTTGSSDWR